MSVKVLGSRSGLVIDAGVCEGHEAVFSQRWPVEIDRVSTLTQEELGGVGMSTREIGEALTFFVMHRRPTLLELLAWGHGWDGEGRIIAPGLARGPNADGFIGVPYFHRNSAGIRRLDLHWASEGHRWPEEYLVLVVARHPPQLMF